MNRIRTFVSLIFFLGLVCAVTSQAIAGSINIAVLESRNEAASEQVSRVFRDEISALLEGDHQVTFRSLLVPPAASEQEIYRLLDQAYSTGEVDYVLVLDIAANQVVGRHSRFKKPTFLPIVLNARLLGYPESNGTSGVSNLNYATEYVDFKTELSGLQRVASFEDAALVIDPLLNATMPENVKEALTEQASQAGVRLAIVPFETTDQVLSQLDTDAQAVLLGYFPRKEPESIRSLIEIINNRALPSFSLSGEEYVQLGALATNVLNTDWQRRARLMSIRMQEVILGANAADLSVYFETSNQLLINMQTSRQIRRAPGFAVMSEALLINEDSAETAGRQYSLSSAIETAIKTNLAILAQRYSVAEQESAVDEARSSLLPRLDLGGTYLRRKETSSTRSGMFAEESTDGSLTLSQSLFDEGRWAAFSIQKYGALSERELLREAELDISLSAANAYLNVLRAQTSLQQERYNLDVTRENFRLAKTRVEVGSSDRSDLLRWESELANTKRALLEARSQVSQQKQTLNRILNRPINEPLSTTVETVDNPDLLISDDRINRVIENRYSLDALTAFFVDRGIEKSPEIKQLEAQLAASRRQLQSDRRAYWLPDLELVSQYTNNLSESRQGGQLTDDDDWTVQLEMTLPLFEGGARHARKQQNTAAMYRIEATLRDARNEVELEIRSQAEEVHASLLSIDLAKTAERASQQNYDLVASSYARGQVAITELLDAQETLIDARESAMNASYEFLLDLMSFQRATGEFDFFLSA